jgi:hypothetical protein
MRKKIILFAVLFAVVGMLFAQSAQNRAMFIGTWRRLDYGSQNPATWIFSADGSLTINGTARRWALTENYFFLAMASQGNFDYAYQYEFSSDGRTLILYLPMSNYAQPICLIKQ